MQKIYFKILPFIIILIVITTANSQDVTINEVMFDPAGADYYDEFVELINAGDSSASINGMQLSVNGISSGLLAVDSSFGLVLKPSCFALIMEKDYFLNHKSSTYDALIPDSTLLLVISKSAFGTGGLKNSMSNLIALVSADSETLSIVATTPNQSSGFSDERIYPDGSDSSENWGNSRVLYGTPGFRNSISPLPFDVSLSEFRLITDPSLVDVGKSIEVSISVKNIGINICDSVMIRLGEDSDNNGVLNVSEIAFSTIESISPKDSVTFHPTIIFSRSGVHLLIAEAFYGPDNNSENNRHTLNLPVPYPKNCLAINEFMYCPSSGTGGEWVELFNISGDTINLRYWTLSDNATTAKLTESDFYLPPEQYAVIANDSSFLRFWGGQPYFLKSLKPIPALNNTSDSIIIRDLCKRRIDALGYSNKWGYATNVSLERKNPFILSSAAVNWALSVSAEGATPGQENSVVLQHFDLAVDSVAAFLNIGDRETVFSTQVAVRNCGQTRCDSATLILNESHSNQYAELVRFPIDAVEPEESKMLNVSFGPFCSGMHRLSAVVQWKPDTRKSNDSLTFCIKVAYPEESLILSEFLAYPAGILTAKSSISEYIEFYNPTQDSISMEGWSVSDENTGRLATIESSKIVPPGGYFVIASDSSIFKFPEIPSDKVAVMANFPSLNNDEDRIFLFDPTCSTVDSLWYTPAWKIEQNVAMERVFFTNPNTYNNWRQSVSKSGGTPGLPNSVAISTEMQKPGIRVEPNPFSPDGDGQDEEVAIQYRLPYPSAQISIEVYDIAGRLIYKPGDHLTTSSEGVVYWNGDSEYGDKARTGIYIVKCSAADLGSRKSVGYVTTVVLVRSWR